MPSNNILLGNFKNKFFHNFKTKQDFNNLLSWIIGYENLYNENYVISRKNIKKFNKYFNKYLKGIPVAYITKNVYFYNIELYIKKGVFIPRIDSEKMIDQIIEQNDLENKSVLDLCCGSGALGLSLKAANKNIKLTLVEKYKQPYKVCKINSKKFNNVKCIKNDYINILNNLNDKFDIIIINPPYICKDDESIDLNVKKFEPHSALYAEDNGFSFYKSIKEYLDKVFLKNCNVIFYIEFGWKQKEKLENLFKNTGEVQFYKDYNNNWRYLTIRKLNE